MEPIKLLHLHLPKTGGTALWRFFVDQFGEQAVTPPQQAIMLSEALLQWEDRPVISGHFIARHGDTIPHDRMALSVLRDPVDRFLSEYFYHQYDVDNQPIEVGRRVRSLDEHIAHLAQLSNDSVLVQTEMLYPLGTDAQTRLTTEEKLAAAKNAIDGFSLVGIQSEMDDFCSMLNATFHRTPSAVRRINVTSRRIDQDTLTEAQRRAIRQLVEPEIELYEYARSRFRRDRRSFISSANRVPQGEPEPVSPPIPSAAPSQKRDFGDLRCEICGVEVIGRASGPGQVMTGEPMTVALHISVHEKLDDVNVGIAIKNERGSLVFGTNSLLLGETYAVSPGRYVISFNLLNRLGPGTFQLDAALTPTSSHYDGCFHWRHDVASFSVPAYATHHFEGQVMMDVDLNVENVEAGSECTRKCAVGEHAPLRTFGNTSKTLTDFRSTLNIMSRVDMVPRGSDLLLQVKVTNNGAEAWPHGGRYPTHLSYRWLAPDGTIIVADGLRSELACDVQPGSSLVTYMQVRTPDQAGKFQLIASLVQEHVAWFIDTGGDNGRAMPLTVS
ncbi:MULTISPECIES: Wzt carbohydrate-binding domain-containing protein [unclassified Dyella]|uniref:Wzt carbohydrate-binding domain-containing protein n=1 Tax=unclassified Dyella TaxID=2634549 RepID=UPI000C82DA5E|nr:MULTISPECIES: Wzt carbohydrate-binding domain-containing protein [unclassified Dyella]MDR3444410.1 Wzt carbohydrate-binding domain-containing protein [Dyella sp.]PMQ06007.1 hypothetical protein DyAD56_07085 [Dyella sp. AD56]